MRIAVCDDDRMVLELFREIFEGKEYHGRTEASFFGSAGELIAAAEELPFDLIFTDIMLGEENGIETAAKVCAIRPETRVIFITSHVLEYAEEIFSRVRPYGYIGKPVYPPKVAYYIDRLEDEIAGAERELTVSIHGTEYRLKMEEICFLESEKRQVHIHCPGRTLSVYEKLDSIEQRLDDRFVRCHQSFAVNIDWVLRLEGTTLTLRKLPEEEQSREINISRNRLETTRRSYFEHKGRSII